MTTRSLSVAKTGRYLNSSLDIADLALLYYENPTGKVTALCQDSYSAVPGSGDSSIIQEWIDVTSQESKSLPAIFRNNSTSAADGNSKTLDESFMSNIYTLSAPFTCQTVNGTQQPGLDAFFYSLNASYFRFQSNSYLTGSSGPGMFSPSTYFVFSYRVNMFRS